MRRFRLGPQLDKRAGTDVVVLSGMMGVGKTALLSAWLQAIRRSEYRGASFVYYWSFNAKRIGEFFVDLARWLGLGERPDPALLTAELSAAARRAARLDGADALPPDELRALVDG